MQPETILIFTAFSAVVGISVFMFWRMEKFLDKLQERKKLEEKKKREQV